MKTCTKCKEKKPLNDFHADKRLKDGRTNSCKGCNNARRRARCEEIGYDVLYKRSLASSGEDRYRERRRAYYQKNKEHIKAKSRKWKAENKERKAETSRKYYEENKGAYLERAKKWARDNKDRRTEICMAYMRRMRKENPKEFVAAETARKMLSRVLESTGRKKRGRTFDIIGYNRQEFENHIESLFEPGMTWDNHGEWHIDHRIPVSELVRCGVTAPAKINALSNLRPMWAAENMAKRNHFELAPPCTAHITRAS